LEFPPLCGTCGLSLPLLFFGGFSSKRFCCPDPGPLFFPLFCAAAALFDAAMFFLFPIRSGLRFSPPLCPRWSFVVFCPSLLASSPLFHAPAFARFGFGSPPQPGFAASFLVAPTDLLFTQPLTSISLRPWGLTALSFLDFVPLSNFFCFLKPLVPVLLSCVSKCAPSFLPPPFPVFPPICVFFFLCLLRRYALLPPRSIFLAGGLVGHCWGRFCQTIDY